MKTKTQHELKADLAVGDGEVTLTIKFAYRPGSPAAAPTYFHGGLPPEPPEIEFESCVGPLEGDVFDRYRQDSFDTLAESYLESDAGFEHAIKIAEEERQ